MTEEPTSAQPDVTLEQATNAVALISQQSKKDLAVALKNKNNVASEALYAVFKESSSLLETLENTFDISTIPDIETQISTLQQNLYQASSLLDGDFNAQS